MIGCMKNVLLIIMKRYIKKLKPAVKSLFISHLEKYYVSLTHGKHSNNTSVKI